MAFVTLMSFVGMIFAYSFKTPLLAVASSFLAVAFNINEINRTFSNK